jgi:hypothetical protein
MEMTDERSIKRRDFIRRAGAAGGALACGPLAWAGDGVCLVADPADPVASSAPAAWAAGELAQELAKAGIAVRRCERPEQARSGELAIIAAGAGAPVAAAALRSAGLPAPEQPESLALFEIRSSRGTQLLACGADARGLAYALTELADRAGSARNPMQALRVDRPIVEQPANRTRSIMRQFTCELLDKPWFYDREMWPRYLSMLARQRFNRFHLAFGLGYDALRRVADSYFLFLYPFLLQVPGYNVRATNLSAEERDRNLDTLRFIGEQAVARGIEFELGVWMHGYQWPDSPRAQHTIEGLTPDIHAAYCRDALTAVLNACPSIASVALRIHGESGIAEGSYAFWRTVFDGVKRCGRRVEIDLHSKGIDRAMIDNALATGMPVNVTTKCWAEHLGMPYHQAAIRELEMPFEGRTGAGLMTLSEGSLSYTRYGYADLLRDDRKYTVRHRVFSGTQRILLWGDPGWAAAYSRMFGFCGSTGADLMEPLTCRGRRGTGVPGSTRSGYIDSTLEPRWDWEKYAYWYRVFGRTMYNPGTSAEVFDRHWSGGAQARALQAGLAQASRILPIVTTAHLPSAACDAYWPEIYWNQPLSAEAPGNTYTDSPAPKTFQHVSPLDPQLFSGINEFAGELLEGAASGKYSPVEVAVWLEEYAEAAEKSLSAAGRVESPAEHVRAAIDIEMQAALGRFFAARFRSGVLYALYERTGDTRALAEAVKAYRRARAMYARAAERAKNVYATDLSSSDKVSARGQWIDRLPAIDADIAALDERLANAGASTDPRVDAAIAAALGHPRRAPVACKHNPPSRYQPNRPIELSLSVSRPALSWARLYYRHVNQSERYQTAPMEAQGSTYRAVIPAGYTDSPYPLQYYFVLKPENAQASLYPGFAANLSNEPYFVIQKS